MCNMFWIPNLTYPGCAQCFCPKCDKPASECVFWGTGGLLLLIASCSLVKIHQLHEYFLWRKNNEFGCVDEHFSPSVRTLFTGKQWFCFQTEVESCWDTFIPYFSFLVLKIKNLRCNLSDISAETKTLLGSRWQSYDCNAVILFSKLNRIFLGCVPPVDSSFFVTNINDFQAAPTDVSAKTKSTAVM